jgi:hypothetical protein
MKSSLSKDETSHGSLSHPHPHTLLKELLKNSIGRVCPARNDFFQLTKEVNNMK